MREAILSGGCSMSGQKEAWVDDTDKDKPGTVTING